MESWVYGGMFTHAHTHTRTRAHAHTRTHHLSFAIETNDRESERDR